MTDDNMQTIIDAATCILCQIAKGNVKEATPDKFSSNLVPDLSIADYMARIQKYFNCSESCFVAMLIYLDRLTSSTPIVVNLSNIYRLLLTSMVLAVKFWEDKLRTNTFYAKVGGVSLKELNEMESNGLRLLEWNVHISDQDYQIYFNELKLHSTHCPTCQHKHSTCNLNNLNTAAVVSKKVIHVPDDGLFTNSWSWAR